MLQIGSIKLEHPFVQAALSGYSDLPMRRIARRFGASYTINEVVLERSVLHDGAWQRQLLSVTDDDHPVGAQLMGADPNLFGPAAKRMADSGYDVIDINFGCPVNKVLKRCRGGYLLGEPETALEIVQNVLDAVGAEKPVTVKMRRGIDDSIESERAFFQIIDGCFDAGVSAVTVHGRTVTQRYSGPSNWEFLKRAKQHIGDRTMLGSGDLMSADDCVRMMQETGVDGVTVARGAMGNPWIFRECRALAAGEPLPPPPGVLEQGETLAAHLFEAMQYYGNERAGKVMNRVAMRYARHHPKAKYVRQALVGSASTSGLQAILAEWYGVHALPEGACALASPVISRA